MSDREFDNINGIKVCDQTARNSIPTKTSQLENDSNFVTDSVVNEKVDKSQLSFNSNGELVVTIDGISKTFVPKTELFYSFAI